MTIHIRESVRQQAAATFQEQFQSGSIVLDERSGIGPHHLAIGKTRKIFEHKDTVFAFFSRGYEIACARVAAETSEIREIQTLDFPVAWGGGALQAANRLSGNARLAAFGKLDLELMRNVAPFAVMRTYNNRFLFSKRVDPKSLVYEGVYSDWSIPALALKATLTTPTATGSSPSGAAMMFGFRKMMYAMTTKVVTPARTSVPQLAWRSPNLK
jgi:hypothetical protein